MEEIEAIVKFDKLRNYLESIGIHVAEASADGYHAVKPGEVTLQAIKDGTYTFDEDGIYLNGSNGVRQKVFLYKRKYHLVEYGKPRIHIRKCSKIQEFIDSGSFGAEYRHANTEKVPVINMDKGNQDVEVDALPLCGYCKNLVLQEFNENQKDESLKESNIKDSVEFVRLLKETLGISDGLSQEVDADIFSYVKDWEQISRRYREYHNYTCERCGLQITNPWDRQFMQVHHRNGIKTDNNGKNLECLCIRCHANVDDVHRKNFSKGDNLFRLNDFNEKYPPKS